eukprot:scaffold21935_cov16-Prasinocladus_malaysianus.AAC.1
MANSFRKARSASRPSAAGPVSLGCLQDRPGRVTYPGSLMDTADSDERPTTTVQLVRLGCWLQGHSLTGL